MNKPPVVLVHGAWHGEWCWDRVVPLLTRNGHEVYTPTLPGLSDGYEGAAPSLADHIAAVEAVIVERDLRNVVLVGHSYGGMVITGVADSLGERVGSLVYFDAALPADGESFASHIPGVDSESIARREAAFRGMAGGSEWLPVPPPSMVGVVDEADAEWLASRMRPHPLRTWLEPVSLSGTTMESISKTYVVVTDPPTTLMGYPAHAERLRNADGWQVKEMACGHDMMILQPRETANIILEAIPVTA